MLTLIYTSTKLITKNGSWNPQDLVYVYSWDAMMMRAFDKIYKVFRDGTQVYIGYCITTNWNCLNRVKGLHAWAWPGGTGSSWIFYGADEITGQHHVADVLNPTWKPPLADLRAGDYVDDSYVGLFLHSYANGIVRVYRLADGVLLGSITVPGWSFTFTNLSYVAPGKVLALYKTTGKIALMDYINRAVVWTSKVQPFLSAAYDCVHHLVITIGSDYKVRVYTLDIEPSIISAPAFDPPSDHVHAYSGTKVKTRVTGDASEPVPGRVVTWELLGPIGSLLRPTSKTDADGYAENYYFGPTTSPASETIRVRVTV